MNKSDLFYLLALKDAPNIGDLMAKKLLRKFGSAAKVFSQKSSLLSKIDNMGSARVKSLRSKERFKNAEKELKYIDKNQVGYYLFTDPGYPEKLKYCIDGPTVLFYKGKIDLADKPFVLSVVGTRKLTTYGKSFINDMIKSLAPLNPVVISGYAYGADITAHKAAMDHNLQTVAVMAHGLNQTYPRKHKKYNERMMENGGFMTDYWHDDKFDRNNFLGRNRIIAGLSEATVVIESAAKGGSLVTAELATGYNREVFALPGRVTDKLSEGCNNLIKQAKAHALTVPADIPYILNWDVNDKEPNVQKQLFVELTEPQQAIYDILKKEDRMLLDLIALECGKPVHEVASLLMSMELQGVVRPLPGKMFSLA